MRKVLFVLRQRANIGVLRDFFKSAMIRLIEQMCLGSFKRGWLDVSKLVCWLAQFVFVSHVSNAQVDPTLWVQLERNWLRRDSSAAHHDPLRIHDFRSITARRIGLLLQISVPFDKLLS